MNSHDRVCDRFYDTLPSFTIELFVRGDDVRSRVLNADGELQRDALSVGGIYHSPTVFQLKAMLYHAGILTSRGAEPSNLDPTAGVGVTRVGVPVALSPNRVRGRTAL